MKIAVLSDIHGNLAALRAVLNDLRMNRTDHIILAGDYVTDGPQPDRVLDILAELKSATMIKGNREDYMLTGENGIPAEWREYEQLGALLWTYQRLSRTHMEFIRSMKPQATVRLEPADAIRVVHGSPYDSSELLFPDRFPERMERALKMTAENVLICGHTHEAWSRQYGTRLVVNPGSVGLHFNRNRSAEYALLIWTGTKWIAEHREVTYDLGDVEKQMADSGLSKACPIWSKVVLMALRTGRNIPIELIRSAKKLMEERGCEPNHFVPNEIWRLADQLWEW